MKKLSFINLGCPKNQVDSEIMLGLLREEGFELTSRDEEAEVVVVNTCGFIDAAKEESVNALVQLGTLKRGGQCKVLIAAGCLPQRYGKELLAEMPEVDAVVGTGDFARIAEICREVLRKGEAPTEWRAPVYAVSTPERADYEIALPRVRLSPRHTAYVKISEGCDHACTFCIIPTLRGKQRSRSMESIVTEAETLAREGVKEINLIGQDLTAYGRDRMEREGLARLLRQLVKVDGIEWIRMLYTYPGAFTKELIAVMAGEEKICRYVDMPVQHASDPILRRMRRGTTRVKIEKTLALLRNEISEVVLRTSLIVGFPGETERRFQELLDFVQEAAFDRLGVFTYSHEEGTAAAAFPDRIPAKEKARRREAVLELQQGISMERQLALVGSRQRVLVDGPSPDHPECLTARTFGHAPEVDGEVLIEKADLPSGSFADVEIIGADPYDLMARVVP
ncbi:MAG: 30S ribosomal protein S12 methylthiotransferase RimO [Nitrospirae bacterium]|nr:30S ribosomal protein S12 methylthiotransferase RimO [Nitrospirota bacterium]